MLDVRELVRDHPFELLVARECCRMPSVAATAACCGIAAGRERVRRRLGNDVDLRHRQAGALRQAGDDL